MTDPNVKLAQHDEQIKSIKDDIQDIKDSIKEINNKLNGYLDKKIEVKVRTMDTFFEQTINKTIDRRMGKWMIGFALSIITTWLMGMLTGKYWFR
jgi:tetrahydromethanopterin S-methyltransferase subunit G